MTLAKSNEITKIEGYVSSNPVKGAAFGSSYKTSFTVRKVFTENGAFSADGEVLLYFPKDLVEAFYPGKLYTSAAKRVEKGFLIENGADFSLDVDFAPVKGKTAFIVRSGKALGWTGGKIASRICHFRALCRLQFKRLMYGWGKAGGLLLALLSGSREYTEKAVSDAFRDSGLSHILALSGMHLGLFGAIARFLGRKASGRNLGDAVQLLAILFFVWFAGLSPSLFRAFLAALILYLNSLFRMNRPEPVSLLSVCFLVHVIIFPSHVFEAAFMLSYSSLGGIMILSRYVRKVCPAFVPYKVRLSLSDSTAAQIATSAISLKLFGKIAPIGIIASLFVSPLVFLFLYIGLFGIIISLFLPFLSVPISAIMNLLYLFISKLVLFFSFK
ncbi:ComEC/Rec2 family competence protein [uncultured Treponema sp.]|uniref:ComEC/Rec2 family competence protein n=1 Tax=uncultured Treponema sp. TaxID=162155 RepID=UPI0025D0CC50|nr:ComEC/Rec2 family competence protein [uncultured Treponema sp.]